MSSSKLKIALLGESGCGKTALLSRLQFGTFESQHVETIGVDFVSHRVNNELWLQFWDTAGMPRFQCLASTYIRQCAVAIVVYDVSNRDSFKQTTKWVNIVRAERSDMTIFLVANKCDSLTRTVSEVEGTNKASELDVFFFETSAKTGQNVHKLFDKVVREAQLVRDRPSSQAREQWVRIDISVPQAGGSSSNNNNNSSSSSRSNAYRGSASNTETTPSLEEVGCMHWLLALILSIGKRTIACMSGNEQSDALPR